LRYQSKRQALCRANQQLKPPKDAIVQRSRKESIEDIQQFYHQSFLLREVIDDKCKYTTTSAIRFIQKTCGTSTSLFAMSRRDLLRRFSHTFYHFFSRHPAVVDRLGLPACVFRFFVRVLFLPLACLPSLILAFFRTASLDFSLCFPTSSTTCHVSPASPRREMQQPRRRQRRR